MSWILMPLYFYNFINNMVIYSCDWIYLFLYSCLLFGRWSQIRSSAAKLTHSQGFSLSLFSRPLYLSFHWYGNSFHWTHVSVWSLTTQRGRNAEIFSLYTRLSLGRLRRYLIFACCSTPIPRLNMKLSCLYIDVFTYIQYKFVISSWLDWYFY